MTEAQKRLLKDMKHTYFGAAIVIFVFCAAAVGLVAFPLGKNIMLLIIIGSLALSFTVFTIVENIKTYRKSADIIMNGQAERCVVEQLFAVKKGKDYVYTPVVRTSEGQLLITFGEYDHSMYVAIRVRSLADRVNLQIQRKDRSILNIGDTVLVYIKNYPDFKFNTDMLDKSTNNYESKRAALAEVKMFEGIVDVELQN